MGSFKGTVSTGFVGTTGTDWSVSSVRDYSTSLQSATNVLVRQESVAQSELHMSSRSPRYLTALWRLCMRGATSCARSCFTRAVTRNDTVLALGRGKVGATPISCVLEGEQRNTHTQPDDASGIITYGTPLLSSQKKRHDSGTSTSKVSAPQ